jgi:hypothetical protein
MIWDYGDMIPGGLNIKYGSSKTYKMKTPMTYDHILKKIEKNHILDKIKFWLISRKWLSYRLEIRYATAIYLEDFLKNDGVEYTRIDIGDLPICYFCFTDESVSHMRIIQ